jgi:hypothetical protein
MLNVKQLLIVPDYSQPFLKDIKKIPPGTLYSVTEVKRLFSKKVPQYMMPRIVRANLKMFKCYTGIGKSTVGKRLLYWGNPQDVVLLKKKGILLDVT